MADVTISDLPLTTNIPISAVLPVSFQNSTFRTTTTKLGIVRQVIQSVYYDYFSVTSPARTAVNTPLSATITPSSVNSRIRVEIYANIGYSGYTYCLLGRNGTTLNQYIGKQYGNVARVAAAPPYLTNPYYYNMWPVSFSYIDSPNTTQPTTYQLQLQVAYTSQHAILNLGYYAYYVDGSNQDQAITPSNIILTEYGE